MNWNIIVVVVLLTILSTGCISNQSTPYSLFGLNINESTTIPYSVDKPYPNQFMVSPQDSWKYADTMGYNILSTTTPGSYNITITTNKPEDKITVVWKNTFDGQNCDKFSCSTVRQFHWSSAYTIHCESNRHSDCSMDMVLDNATKPILEIWIIGKGSGQIKITRVG